MQVSLGQVEPPAMIPFWDPGNPEYKPAYKEYPSWCDSWLLSRIGGLFSDACTPQSEESIWRGGEAEVQAMCRKVEAQGIETFEECWARYKAVEPYYRQQFEAATASSRERDPEAYCEYEASQEHPRLYGVLGGWVACKYKQMDELLPGGMPVWILLAAGAGLYFLLKK